MKHNRRPLISLLLALIMALSFVPATAVSSSALGLNLFGSKSSNSNATPKQSGTYIAGSNGNYQLYQDGKVQSNFNGTMYGAINGKTGYWYIQNGKVQMNYTGITQTTVAGKAGKYYIQNGCVRTDYNGDVSVEKGRKAYTLSNGRVVGYQINVPQINQMPDYPTGCEAASATSLLNWYGVNATLDEMINTIPRENIYIEDEKPYGPSIYEKFVGDPTSTYTAGNPGYGAFAPVVTKALNQSIAKHRSSKKAVNITGTAPSALYNKVRNGDPVLVWATYNMKVPNTVNAWYVKTNDGGEYYFTYPRGTHVMILCGVNDEQGTVTVMDPYGATFKTFYKSDFESKYDLLGKMAITIQ